LNVRGGVLRDKEAPNAFRQLEADWAEIPAVKMSLVILGDDPLS
jgi:hypothetical protein